LTFNAWHGRTVDIRFHIFMASKNVACMWVFFLMLSNFAYRLGGVVVSVLATGPKGCEFEPGQGDGFLQVIKSTEYFPSDVK